MLFAAVRTFYLSILYFSYFLFYFTLVFGFVSAFCWLHINELYMRYIFLFATSCYSSLSACCCGVCCCCCCCCVSQAVWVTNDKTKTCRGAVCDDDKDLVVRCVSLSACLSFCGIQGAACNKLQCQWQWQLLLDWSTNLAYCTTFHRKRQTLRWSTLIAHWLTFVVCFVFTLIVSFVVAVPARCCCCFSCCCCCRCCH